MSDLRMPDINKVMLAGRLTRDPELQYIPSGTALCKMGLAVSRKYKTKTGEMREDTLFVDVTTWGASAEYCGEHMRKGAPVLVEGRLQLDQWESKEGEKRSKLRVVCEHFTFVGSRDDAAGGGSAAGGGDGGSAPASSGGGDDDLPF